jgi:hypothetical protein
MATTVKYTDAHRPPEQAIAGEFGTRSHEPCPLFWPEQEQHGVRYVPLEASITEEVAPLTPKLRELAAVGDALRSLQTRDGSLLSDHAADVLAERTGTMLLELAGALNGETAEILRMRAGAFLEGGSHRDASIREAELYDSQPLTVLCGPLCTWRLKTRTPLHTVVAASACRPYDELVAALDEHLDGAAAELREELSLPELQMHSSYPMRVTDMIACGGEANAYPKHFAYFLPEDEAVPDAPEQRKKTVVFRNAYRERYSVISRPLGESLLEGPISAPVGPAEGPLLVWFRGHDIGHSATLPSTDYSWRLDLGHEPFMMIQEALADVYGYLLGLTPAWLSLSKVSATDVSVTFLSELLHYLRRGPWLHGDAGAAYLELSYLAANNYVSIDAAGQIHWETERLHEGMRALARELAAAVLAPTDAQPCARLVAQYGWPTKTPAARVLGELHSKLRGVPSALAYRDAPAAAQSVPAGEQSDLAAARAS